MEEERLPPRPSGGDEEEGEIESQEVEQGGRNRNEKEVFEESVSPVVPLDPSFEERLEEDDYYEDLYGDGSGSFSGKRMAGGGGKYGEISSSVYSRRKKKKKERRKDTNMYKIQGRVQYQSVHVLKREARRRYNILFNIAKRIGVNLQNIMTADDVYEAIKQNQENSLYNRKNLRAEERKHRRQEERDVQEAIEQSRLVSKRQIKVARSAQENPNFTDVEQLLYDLQFREVTPQDYELLGLLDESVAPKSTSSSAMNKNTRVRKASSDDCGECVICYENIEVGQEIREITQCKHYFHKDCIDTYLTRFARKCPTCRIDITEI